MANEGCQASLYRLKGQAGILARSGSHLLARSLSSCLQVRQNMPALLQLHAEPFDYCRRCLSLAFEIFFSCFDGLVKRQKGGGGMAGFVESESGIRSNMKKKGN